jgi:hypothetical protein
LVVRSIDADYYIVKSATAVSSKKALPSLLREPMTVFGGMRSLLLYLPCISNAFTKAKNEVIKVTIMLAANLCDTPPLRGAAWAMALSLGVRNI